ncbi:MAG: YlmH/Sll1252 family protein, partial [Defluviitaleaceae bacterium]|nr:YlmH/Sll1252 family protein [Defluviitaleaceae bacterium]
LEKSADMPTIAHGGHDNAERRMLGFFPETTADAKGDEFPISPVSITYNERFSAPPTHRDYLGATLGLGLDRGKIGDILLGESGAVVYVITDVAAFICENLVQVKRTSVKASLDAPLPGTETPGVEKHITVPSLRLDAVLGAAFNISRGKSTALIESEKVFVNWKPAKKTRPIAPGDVITVRGLGRVKIDSLEGHTKKDRIILKITKF